MFDTTTLHIPPEDEFPAILPEKSLDEPRFRFDPEAAVAARREQRASWATLKLRQDFPDEAFMRSHLKAAGIRIADRNEPASAYRLSSLLRKARVKPRERMDAIGCNLHVFLRLNPVLPLWAAQVLILEATGKFVIEAIPAAKEALR